MTSETVLAPTGISVIVYYNQLLLSSITIIILYAAVYSYLGYANVDAYRDSEEYKNLVGTMKLIAEDQTLTLEDYIDPFKNSGKPEKEVF